MGRLIRTTLPTPTKVLEPKRPNHTAVKRADIKAKRGYKEFFEKKKWLARITTATVGRLGQSQTG